MDVKVYAKADHFKLCNILDTCEETDEEECAAELEAQRASAAQQADHERSASASSYANVEHLTPSIAALVVLVRPDLVLQPCNPNVC